MLSSTKIVLLLATLQLAGCLRNFRHASQRRLPGMGPEDAGQIFTRSRDGSLKRESRPLFVEKKNVRIEPSPGAVRSGSLFQLENRDNFLFVERSPVAVEELVAVTLPPLKGEGGKGPVAPPPAEGAGGDAEAAPETDAAAKPPSVPPVLKMKVAKRLPNGDVELVFRRSSESQGRIREVLVRAQAPYSKILRGEELATDDLSDVRVVERVDQEEVRSSALSWEPAFTRRLRDFEEIQIGVQRDLEVRRRSLARIQKKLDRKLKALGQERKQMASERDGLLKKNSQLSQDLGTSRQEVEKQKTQIDEQKRQLEELRREDLPGDERDGEGV